jgi:hypothetical protein
MAVTYKAQPKNPVDFFAKWLLSQSAIAKSQLKAAERVNNIKELKEEHSNIMKTRQMEAAEQKALEQ